MMEVWGEEVGRTRRLRRKLKAMLRNGGQDWPLGCLQQTRGRQSGRSRMYQSHWSAKCIISICTVTCQKKSSLPEQKRWVTDLISISLFVTASLTMSLMQGGGVMGRLSCRLPVRLSLCIYVQYPLEYTYLVAKPAHASPNWLLDHVETARHQWSSRQRGSLASYGPIYPPIFHGTRGCRWPRQAGENGSCRGGGGRVRRLSLRGDSLHGEWRGNVMWSLRLCNIHSAEYTVTFTRSCLPAGSGFQGAVQRRAERLTGTAMVFSQRRRANAAGLTSPGFFSFIQRERDRIATILTRAI